MKLVFACSAHQKIASYQLWLIVDVNVSLFLVCILWDRGGCNVCHPLRILGGSLTLEILRMMVYCLFLEVIFSLPCAILHPSFLRSCPFMEIVSPAKTDKLASKPILALQLSALGSLQIGRAHV